MKQITFEISVLVLGVMAGASVPFLLGFLV